MIGGVCDACPIRGDLDYCSNKCRVIITLEGEHEINSWYKVFIQFRKNLTIYISGIDA